MSTQEETNPLEAGGECSAEQPIPPEEDKEITQRDPISSDADTSSDQQSSTSPTSPSLSPGEEGAKDNESTSEVGKIEEHTPDTWCGRAPKDSVPAAAAEIEPVVHGNLNLTYDENMKIFNSIFEKWQRLRPEYREGQKWAIETREMAFDQKLETLEYEREKRIRELLKGMLRKELINLQSSPEKEQSSPEDDAEWERLRREKERQDIMMNLKVESLAANILEIATNKIFAMTRLLAREDSEESRFDEAACSAEASPSDDIITDENRLDKFIYDMDDIATKLRARRSSSIEISSNSRLSQLVSTPNISSSVPSPSIPSIPNTPDVSEQVRRRSSSAQSSVSEAQRSSPKPFDEVDISKDCTAQSSPDLEATNPPLETSISQDCKALSNPDLEATNLPMETPISQDCKDQSNPDIEATNLPMETLKLDKQRSTKE